MNLDFLFVLLSILIITILIVVHEFGHFLAARYFGFQTPVFGIGLPFGPHIDLFKKWDTHFRFHWLLIGGFVSIPELGDETNEEVVKELSLDKPLRTFPVWQRAIVAFGGIAFNILFAFLLTVMMSATVGLPKAVTDNQIVDFVKENPIARQANIQKGDRIIFVGGQEITDGNQLKKALQKFKSTEVLIKVQRAIDEEQTAFKTVSLSLTPNASGSLGVLLGYKQEYQKLGPNPLVWIWESLRFTALTFAGMMVSIVAMLGTLVVKIFNVFMPQPIETGVPLDQVKGIVGIVQLISQDIQNNWVMIYQFAILLSLNLAVINLLPIPALDGGHLMFMAYEAIAGKKPHEKVQEKAVQIGFMFLLAIIVLTTVNDLKNWFFG